MFDPFKKILLAAMIGATSLSASCSDLCSGWDVGADFLWWKTCENNADFAVLFDHNPFLSNTTASGNFIDLKHDWAPGYRVYAEKKSLFCNLNLYGSYTHFQADDSGSISTLGGFLFSTLSDAGFNDFAPGTINTVKARHKLRYQTFDVLLSYDCCLCNAQLFSPFFGIEGLKLNESWHSTILGTLSGQPGEETINWCSNYEAIGLKVGAQYEYALSCGLNLFAIGSLSLLAGSDSSRNCQVTSTLDSQLQNPVSLAENFKENECLCQPGAHIAFGFSYNKCVCGKTVGVRIGYEFTDWWNVPTIRHFNAAGEATGISTSSAGSNLVLHGLFAGLDVGF